MGAIVGGNQQGDTATNPYRLSSANINDLQNRSIANAMNIKGGGNTPEEIQGQVQNDKVLGGLFGQGGALQDTESQVKNLEGQGFQLTPEDQTAYGQASGNIARMFGQSDQSLSQSLADRGLSNSGAAGAAFTGSAGNKNEQLGQLQTQIAQNRMQMNQQRLQSMQNFMGQLGGQAQQALTGQSNRNIANTNAYNQAQEQQMGAAQGLLGNFANQENQKISQQNQGAHSSNFATGLGGLMQLGAGAGQLMSGMPPTAMSGGQTGSQTTPGNQSTYNPWSGVQSATAGMSK